MNPEISILVITHNQKPLLERCLESILNQIIIVPYEIIVSDDGLDDGTREYVLRLSNSERVLSKTNLIRLQYSYCKTDDHLIRECVSPIGWNRLNAYKQARGKYFVNVDADDFLVGDSLYQKEYDVIEAHPECSMVQTRALKLFDGENVDQVHDCYPFSEKLENGSVFTLEEVLRFGLRGQHQTYMYRRRPEDDVERVLGGHYDDINITYYHLQYGSVVFLDESGYVWVQYSRSDSHVLSNDDKKVLYGFIPLRLAMLFENSKYVFLGLGIRKLWCAFRAVPVHPKLSERVSRFCLENQVFVFRFYGEKHHSILSWCRYGLIWWLLLMMKKLRLETRFWLDLLYKSMF